MLRYRIVRSISNGYPYVVLTGYVLAFFVAMAMMFIFPPGTLLMLGLGLASLVAVYLVHRALAAVMRLVARGILDAGACPDCSARMQSRRDAAAPWKCEMCEATFLPSGAELDPLMPAG